jgi:hypothetical protein
MHVYRVDDPRGRHEIRILQFENQRFHFAEVASHFALDQRAVWNTARRGDALADGLRLAFDRVSTHRDRALRDRINLVIRSAQLRHDERSTEQGGSVTHRRNRNIHSRAAGNEGRQIGGYEHSSDVPRSKRRSSNVDSHVVEHRLQRLLGEGRISQGVAGALEPDHQPISQDLVLSHALQVGDVLDPYRGIGGRDRKDEDNPPYQPAYHPFWIRTEPSGWMTPLIVTPVSRFLS